MRSGNQVSNAWKIVCTVQYCYSLARNPFHMFCMDLELSSTDPDPDPRSRTHCKENSICVFVERKLRGLIPNFYIYKSVSDLYISTISQPIFLQPNRQTDSGNFVPIFGPVCFQLMIPLWKAKKVPVGKTACYVLFCIIPKNSIEFMVSILLQLWLNYLSLSLASKTGAQVDKK